MLKSMLFAFWSVYSTSKLPPPKKTDIISEDIKLLWSYMCSLVEILRVLEDEIGLVCWQLPHEIHVMEIFWIQPTCELSLFSFKMSKLIRYFYWLSETKSIWNISKLLKQLFDALETNSLTLMTVLKIFFFTFYIVNMAENETQRELQIMI